MIAVDGIGPAAATPRKFAGSERRDGANIWPTQPLRQLVGQATTGGFGLLFEARAAVDLPCKPAPSLYTGVLPVLWVRFAAYLAGWLRVALHAWFALIMVSVLTTYQHHVIDVPAGLAVGGLWIALTARRGTARGREHLLRRAP